MSLHTAVTAAAVCRLGPGGGTDDKLQFATAHRGVLLGAKRQVVLGRRKSGNFNENCHLPVPGE